MPLATELKVLRIRYGNILVLFFFIGLAIALLALLVLHVTGLFTAAPFWCWIFLAVGTPLALANWIVGRQRSYIELAPDGLTIRHLGRRRLYRWDDIRNVRLHQYGTVVFDLTPYSSGHTFWTRIARLVSGYDVMISWGFRKSPEKIIELMVQWQAWYAGKEEAQAQPAGDDIVCRLKQWQEKYGQGNQPPP